MTRWQVGWEPGMPREDTFQDITIAGNLTFGAQGTFTAPATLGNFLVGNLNSIRFVDGLKLITIQAAIDNVADVAQSGLVIVPPEHTSEPTVNVPDNVTMKPHVAVLDLRNEGKWKLVSDSDTAPVETATLFVATGNPTANPAAGDWVTAYLYITSSASRNRIWALNPIAHVPAGADATAWAVEVNVNNNVADAPDPRTTLHKLGVDIVSGGNFKPSAALAINSTTAANRWKYAVWIDGTGVDEGIRFNENPANGTAIRMGGPTAGLNAPILARQFSNGGDILVLQRFTDTGQTGNVIRVVNAVNNVNLFTVDKDGNVTAPLLTSTTEARIKRLRATGATTHVAGDYALGGNWGTTPSVSAVAATDHGGRVTVTAGTGSPGANPTIALTFKDGTFTNAPGISYGRGDSAAPTTAFWALTSVTATVATWTFVGTPTASNVYVLDFTAIGR